MLYDAAATDWLFDGHYLPFLRASFGAATRSILVQQFVIDPRPDEDERGEVRYLLHALAEAAHRGLDVRVLLAEVLVERPLPIDLNEPAARFLCARGVSVRRVPERTGIQLHAKSILIDGELVISGSHNWTPGAFQGNTESSVAIMSVDACLLLTQRFEALWAGAEEYPHG